MSFRCMIKLKGDWTRKGEEREEKRKCLLNGFIDVHLVSKVLCLRQSHVLLGNGV